MDEAFWTGEREKALGEKLDPKLTAQRDAFGGGKRKLTYLEGHAAIAQLNRIFGYGGWSYSVDEMGVDEYTQGPAEGWYAGFWAKVTLRVGGVMRQDVGCVEVQNTGKGGTVRDNVHNVDSRSTARKGAVTDALKRAARTFGQQLGNGLYDTDDNIYAWMVAHGLEDQEQDAPATAALSPNGTGQTGERAPKPSVEPGRLMAAPARDVPASVPQDIPGLIRCIEAEAGVNIQGTFTLRDWRDLARTYGAPTPAGNKDLTRAWMIDLLGHIHAGNGTQGKQGHPQQPQVAS